MVFLGVFRKAEGDPTKPPREFLIRLKGSCRCTGAWLASGALGVLAHAPQEAVATRRPERPCPDHGRTSSLSFHRRPPRGPRETLAPQLPERPHGLDATGWQASGGPGGGGRPSPGLGGAFKGGEQIGGHSHTVPATRHPRVAHRTSLSGKRPIASERAFANHGFAAQQSSWSAPSTVSSRGAGDGRGPGLPAGPSYPPPPRTPTSQPSPFPSA